MTYITTLAGRKTTSSLRIMIVVLVGFVLLLLQSSPVQAQWSTSGSNTTTTNNVGIGTASPGELIHVRRDQNSATRMLVENATSGASALADVELKNDSGDLAQFGLYSSTTSTAGALASGNAFAYTTSPAMVIMTNNAGGVIKFATGGLSERARIDASGNFGVGTASPGFHLHVQGTGIQTIAVESTQNGNNAQFAFIGKTAGGTAQQWLLGENLATTGGAFEIFDNTAAQNRFFINTSGNVGIGTTSPSTKLHVVGDSTVTGNLTVTGNIAAKYQDVAEWVLSSQELSAGTVVVLDQTRSNQVIASSQAYDTRVAGVISSQPGIALGESGTGKVLVATTGRVRIKVDAWRGAIQVGDLLVTSDVPGVAMKSQPIDVGGVQIHRPGTLIGKALEPLAKGTSEILVLLSLQ